MYIDNMTRVNKKDMHFCIPSSTFSFSLGRSLISGVAPFPRDSRNSIVELFLSMDAKNELISKSTSALFSLIVIGVFFLMASRREVEGTHLTSVCLKCSLLPTSLRMSWK